MNVVIALGGAVKMGDALRLSSWPGVEFNQWPPVSVLAAIEALDLARADENACLGAAVASGRLVRRLQAIQAEALARACERAETGPSPDLPGHADSPTEPRGSAYEVIDGVDLVAAEVGIPLALGKGEAGSLVLDAVHVITDLPKLAALVREGRLDWALAAKTHDRMARDLEPGTPAWRQAEALLAVRLPGKTWEAAGAATWRVLHRINPRAAAERARKAQQDCFLRISPLPDGMARIDGRLRADDARLITLNLDANADAARDHARATGQGDQRTHQQRRVAYFVSIFRSIHTGVPLRRVNPHPPSGSSHPNTPNYPSTKRHSDTPNHAGAPHQPSASNHPRKPNQPDGPGTPNQPDEPGTPNQPDEPGTPNQPDEPGGSGGSGNREEQVGSEGVLAWWEPPPPPARHGHLPHLNLTMSLNALLGITGEPGHLRGHGDIPADLARDIARQAQKVRLTLVPEPTRGTTPFRPAHGPGDQANCTETNRPYKPRPTVIDQVLGRFPTCTHPGCTTGAATCDIDHVIPYSKGGFTCICNLVPLCRLHHRIKTHAQWATRLTRPDEPYPPGTIEYTSRLGQRHIQLPPLLPGAPDPEDNLTLVERAQHRENAWQSELRRVDPAARPAAGPTPPAQTDLGEPPF